MNFYKYLFLLLINPVKGWEQISKYNVPKEIFQAKVFFPFIGILAVTSFFQFFYLRDESLAYYLQYSIINIAKYYFGYIISSYLLQTIYSRYIKDSAAINKLHIFVLYNMSLLVGFAIVESFFPPNLIDIFKILPLYVAFIVWKGFKFMNIDIKESTFAFVFAVSIIAPCMILNYIFKLIL